MSGSLPSLGAWIETTIRVGNSAVPVKSLPSLGAWIETLHGITSVARLVKSLPSLGAWIETSWRRLTMLALWSLPSLGAWIETETYMKKDKIKCRSLHWERGLKRHIRMNLDRESLGRSLHWERGLKLHNEIFWKNFQQSLPSLGAWIETTPRQMEDYSSTSLPSLGAWIETGFFWRYGCRTVVAPFIGSVD